MFVEKLKKHKFLIGIVIISLIYLILTSVQNPVCQYVSPDDDFFIIDLAKNILDFKWLGDFTGKTLSKGPGASIFIAILNIFGITFMQGHFLLYLGGAILLSYVLRKVIKNDFVNLLVFFVVLFNPAMYSLHLVRVYRDGIYASFLLYVVACAFGIFFNYKEKATKLIPYLIGFGVFGTWMAITREETLWIAPFTIGSGVITCLFIIFDKNCLEKKKKVLLYLIPICIYFIVILGICTLNKINYGEFIRIEQNSKPFKDFIKAASSVDVENPNIRVPISKEAREKIYEVSPSFAKLKNYLDNPDTVGWEQFGIVPGEIEDGWLMWAIYSALDSNDSTNNAKEMNDYLRQITKEINEAFEDGRLKKEDNPVSILDKENLEKLFDNFNEAFEYQVEMKEIWVELGLDQIYRDDNYPKENEYVYREITGNIPTNPLTYNYKVDRIKIRSLLKIEKAYEKLSKPLFYIGLVVFGLMIIRFFIIKPRFENYKELIVLASFLLLYLLRLFVVAYTNSFKFPAFISLYFGSTYSIQFAFEILALVFGVTEIIRLIRRFSKNVKKDEKI